MNLSPAMAACGQVCRRLGWVGANLLLASLASVCGCNEGSSARPTGAAAAIVLPLGLPPVPIPADNPPTASSIVLGRRLFYDANLSKDNSISCSSCHDPQRGFADPRERSIGVGGSTGLRHAPSLLNAAYFPLLFWDGRAASLEAQVGVPMADPLEMNQAHKAALAKLRSDPSYKRLFRNAFGSDQITMKRVENALASFERTLLSGNSPFDQYQYQGRKDALSGAQIRGLAAFEDPRRGNCASCHTISPKYALFTDGEFHNTGEGVGDNEDSLDPGRYRVTRLEKDRGSFLTPSLRNVALTAPYMHDGKLKTLKDVVDFYAGKGNSNPYLDERIARIELSGQERSDLVEFLKSLTGEMPSNAGPPGKDQPQ
jgi:cytochrome c peroxidase